MTKPFFTTRHIYFLYIFFLDFGLAWIATIFIPGLKKLGISVQEMSLREAVFWTALLVSEIPAGLYADRVSKVRALALSSGLLGIGSLLYMSATNISSIIMAEIVIAISFAFGGNSLRAWITSAIKEENTGVKKGEQALTRTLATTQIFRSVIALCAGTLGSMVTQLDQVIIWLPVTIGAGINLFIAMFLMTKKEEEKEESAESIHAHLAKGITTLLHEPTLWWATGAITLFSMLIPYHNYWTLYFRASVGEENMSVVWICSFVTVIIGGWLVHRCGHGRLSETGAILTSLSLPSVALGALALAEKIPTQLGMLILLQLGRGIFQPLIEIFLAKRIKDSVRTTVLAIVSTVSKVACILIPAGVYWLSSGIPDGDFLIRAIWITTSSCMLGMLAILWLLRPHK